MYRAILDLAIDLSEPAGITLAELWRDAGREGVTVRMIDPVGPGGGWPTFEFTCKSDTQLLHFVNFVNKTLGFDRSDVTLDRV